jgi:ComEC/Rec2-related protein
MSLNPPSETASRWIPASGARYPALLTAIALCLGIFIGDKLELDTTWVLASMLVFGVTGFAHIRRESQSHRAIGITAIVFALIAFGAWRIMLANAGRPSASLIELTSANARVEIFARVDGVPFQKQSGWRVPLDLIAIKGTSGDFPVKGRVLLTSIPTLQGLRFGDYIRFVGRAYAPSVRRNPGGFDYADYLHRQGFDATVRPESPITQWPQDRSWSLHNLIDPARQWIRVTLGEYLKDNPQALLVGLLLGDTDRLPKPIYDSFRESGTSHLLAVSGANVWLVVGMILLPMYYFAVPRWPRTVIAVVVIILFSFLTRNEPSVVRASLMVGLILVGQLLWRPVSPFNAVGAAGIIILLFAPSHLFRPGFQLSFAAVLGILIAVGRVEPALKGFWRRRWVYAPVMFIVASVAATLATAPVSAWHFGTVPVAGVISNLVMVPLAGLTAHLGLALLPVQTVSGTIASWLAWVTDWLLTASTRIAQFFADVPWAVVSWSNPSVLILLHLPVAVILILNWRQRYRWFRPLVYYVCGLVMLIATVRIVTPKHAHATLSLLDTGRQRVAIVAASHTDAIGLIDDPGIDDDIDQWVIQPFLRHQFGRPSLETWLPWRRLVTSSPPYAPLKERLMQWRRLYTDDLDTLGSPRLWADIWQGPSATTLMVRDIPNFPATQITNALKHRSTSLTLILPAQGRSAWLREVVDSTQPTQVVFYGKAWRGRTADESLALWRVRYPETIFYSSEIHGGLIVNLITGVQPVHPTIPE